MRPGELVRVTRLKSQSIRPLAARQSKRWPVRRRGSAAQHDNRDQLPVSPLPGAPPPDCSGVGNGDGRGAIGTAAGLGDVTGIGAAVWPPRNGLAAGLARERTDFLRARLPRALTLRAAGLRRAAFDALRRGEADFRFTVLARFAFALRAAPRFFAAAFRAFAFRAMMLLPVFCQSGRDTRPCKS
jgi:hypothetical protein